MVRTLLHLFDFSQYLRFILMRADDPWFRESDAAAEPGDTAAIEPVIGHLKDDHRMGRNYLAHSSGDAINAMLAAVGYNFRRLIQWLRPS